MARGRMLNKSISLSQKFDQLPDDTCRLLATWIIPQLDCNGVFYADAAIVRNLIFPTRVDITIPQVAGYLDAIQAAGLIRRFRADGRTWQYWPGFADNQTGLRPEREKTSYPTPPCNGTELPQQSAGNSQLSDGSLPEESRQDDGKESAESESQSESESESESQSQAESCGEKISKPLSRGNDLPEVGAQMAVLFPGLATEHRDTILQIQTSGWEIGEPIFLEALALFLEASGLEPPEKSEREDWQTSINSHTRSRKLDELKVAYPIVITDMRENGLTVSRPGSITSNLRNYFARQKVGNGNGQGKRSGNSSNRGAGQGERPNTLSAEQRAAFADL